MAKCMAYQSRRRTLMILRRWGRSWTGLSFERFCRTGRWPSGRAGGQASGRLGGRAGGRGAGGQVDGRRGPARRRCAGQGTAAGSGRVWGCSVAAAGLPCCVRHVCTQLARAA
jgi:hypothetical protein